MQQVSAIAGDRPGQLCHAVAVDDKRLFLLGLRPIHLRVDRTVDDPYEALHDVLIYLANTLRDEGALDESECLIDTTFALVKGGGDGSGLTWHGKGL